MSRQEVLKQLKKLMKMYPTSEEATERLWSSIEKIRAEHPEFKEEVEAYIAECEPGLEEEFERLRRILKEKGKP